MSQAKLILDSVRAECQDCEWEWPNNHTRRGRPKTSETERCRAATRAHADNFRHRVVVGYSKEYEVEP